MTEAIPECGSLAVARNVKEPDWLAFSQSFLPAASYDWYWPPDCAAGAATATSGALLSTRTVSTEDARVCPTLSVATASSA